MLRLRSLIERVAAVSTNLAVQQVSIANCYLCENVNSKRCFLALSSNSDFDVNAALRPVQQVQLSEPNSIVQYS